MRLIFFESILVVLVYYVCAVYEDMSSVCDQRPLGTKTAPLPPDNRFAIEIMGVGEEYIPKSKYTVRLFSRDNQSTFIAYTISAKEDQKVNEKNPRRPQLLDTGTIEATPDGINMPNPTCKNTVIQNDITPKTSVQVTWRAPSKGNKCVTLYALVAVKPDVWYNYDGPLSVKVCEDRRKADDMQPAFNGNCQVCEDARYQLTFEGMWSYNTHPEMFPSTRDLARFSDVVGASHGDNFQVWKSNHDASEGLKMLAEQGNTTKLELEIQTALGTDVRTVIKATGPSKPNMTTTAIFRVSQRHHLVSLVCAILPSPDWFLGVANLELCDVVTQKWAKKVRLNLYPMDAGTDSGGSFESPNEETMPAQPISEAIVNKDVPRENMKPFAMLHFDLVKTYIKPQCTKMDENSTDDGDISSYSESNEYQEQVTTTTEAPPVLDPTNLDSDCPVTNWEPWQPCEGECVDGKKNGFQFRLRYFVVDDVVVGRYVKGDEAASDKEVPEECSEKVSTFETRMCEEVCEETSLSEPISPGEKWRT